MVIVFLIVLGLLLSFLAILLSTLVMQTRYFKETIQLIVQYSHIPSGKDKRSLRKLRKIRGYIKRARRRASILFLVHISIFAAVYATLITLVYLLIPVEYGFVEIPIYIPIISYKVDDTYFTHAVLIAFLAFMLPSYLYTRILRVLQRTK